MPTDIYFDLERQNAKFMMSNFCSSLRTKNMSTQKIINSRSLLRTQNTSTQKISNSRGCSTDEI